ncbi:hypothetical protein THF1D04_410002 [Vibrio owensii]|uniref:Uncharacterized protein n=1 Tax=Vibrio owensii TaxID=696485 RepID=A0AAU9Q9W8_9VIBR|nr:hypothetical protein THF1D04_410002 [Vibrio owensii]
MITTYIKALMVSGEVNDKMLVGLASLEKHKKKFLKLHES